MSSVEEGDDMDALLPSNARGFPLIFWPSATFSTARSTANSTIVEEWLAPKLINNMHLPSAGGRRGLVNVEGFTCLYHASIPSTGFLSRRKCTQPTNPKNPGLHSRIRSSAIPAEISLWNIRDTQHSSSR